jgi:hypothetical protein
VRLVWAEHESDVPIPAGSAFGKALRMCESPNAHRRLRSLVVTALLGYNLGTISGAAHFGSLTEYNQLQAGIIAYGP